MYTADVNTSRFHWCLFVDSADYRSVGLLPIHPIKGAALKRYRPVGLGYLRLHKAPCLGHLNVWVSPLEFLTLIWILKSRNLDEKETDTYTNQNSQNDEITHEITNQNHKKKEKIIHETSKIMKKDVKSPQTGKAYNSGSINLAQC